MSYHNMEVYVCTLNPEPIYIYIYIYMHIATKHVFVKGNWIQSSLEA